MSGPGPTALLRIAALSAACAVVLGALGAHALTERLTPESLTAYLTGVRYHFWHALALLLLVALKDHLSPTGFRHTALLFLIGTLLFSGSIYALSTRALYAPEGLRWLGPITPLGGLLLITGWIRLATAIKQTPRT